MEALVIIFAEIMLACLMPLLGLIGAIFGALFEGLLLLFGGVFSDYVAQRRKRKADAAGRPPVPRKPLIPRKVVHWVAGTSAALGILGIVASFVLFQPILRYAMDLASEKAGMSVTYSQASGTLLRGHVVLEGLALTRSHETGLAFDLEIARAEANVSLFSLLGNTPTLILGHVEGVSGTLTPPEPKEKQKGLPKERRPFQADRFALENVALQITPRDDDDYAVLIERAEVAPFRSDLAVFDLLFRSNMRAEIAGQTLTVETRDLTENGRITRWSFEDVDAVQLKRILPKAPLTWIEAGQINVAVDDTWSLSEDFINMDWRIASEGLRTTTPDGAGTAERILAAGLSKYVDRFGGDVDFHYRLELSPKDVARLRSGDLDGFWQTLLSGIVKGGVTRAEAEEAVEEEKPGAVDRLRSLFNRDSSDD